MKHRIDPRGARAAIAAALRECSRRLSPAGTFGSLRALPAGSAVWIAARVSTAKQKANGSLDRAVRDIRAAVDAAGLAIVGVTAVVHDGRDPSWIRPVVRAARRAGAAALVFGELTRAIRGRDFTGTDAWDAEPNWAAFYRLRNAADEMRLVLVNSVVDPRDVRTAQILRGRNQSGRRGGRPRRGEGPMTRRVRKLRPRVRELYAEHVSIRDIARLVGVPRSTVFRWCGMGADGMTY
jgi:hypothetical protein